MRGSSIKSFLRLGLDHGARVLPACVIAGFVAALVGAVRLGYWIPGDALRQSCTNVAALASRAGHAHRPHVIYARLLA